MSEVSRGRAARLVRSPPVVGIAVFLLGVVAVLLAPAGSHVAAWWPAAGVAVAAVACSTGRRRHVLLIVVAVAGLLANLAGGRHPVLAACFALADTAEAALAGWLLTRRGRPTLRTLPDLGRLVTAAAAGAATAGGLSALAVAAVAGGDPWTVGWAVTASHGAAVLVLVPTAMRLPVPAASIGWPESAALWTAVVVATVAVFGPGQLLPLTFVPVTVLVWTGLRLGVRTASAQLAVVGAAVAVFTGQGSGPFGTAGRALAPAVTGALVASFVVGCALVVLAPAISVGRRDTALRALAEQRRFDRAVLEVVDAGVLACDAAGRVVVRNRAHRRVTGVGDDEVVDPDQLIRRLEVTERGAPVAAERTPLRRALAGEEITDLTLRMGPAGAPAHDLVTMARPIRDPDGRLLGAVAAFTDVTRERAVQARLQESVAFRDAVLTASPDLIFTVDAVTHSTLWMSRSVTVLLGHGAPAVAAMGGALLTALVHPDDIERTRTVDTAARAVADGEVIGLRIRIRDSTGGYRWFSRRVTPFARSRDGTVTQLLGVSRDVTDTVSMEERLADAALHDPLTTLPNRRLLTDRLDTALRRTARTGGVVPVLFCDLDGFKRVNDTAGHAAGDEVLRLTAERLRGVLRPGDTAARVGGDEFVAVLDPGLHAVPAVPTGAVGAAEVRRHARAVARRIIAALSDPMTVDGVSHVVTVSIGITFAASGDDPAETLRHADQAMYHAKTRGKNRYEIFDGTGGAVPERTLQRP